MNDKVMIAPYLASSYLIFLNRKTKFNLGY